MGADGKIRAEQARGLLLAVNPHGRFDASMAVLL